MRSTLLNFACCALGGTLAAQTGFYWEQRASLPASGRYGSFSFTIDGYGYVVGGGNAGGVLADCWRYDPLADSWYPVASLPAGRRHGASFAIDGKGYITCGGVGLDFTTSDLLMYDPVTDSWTTKAALPATPRNGCYGFALGGYGFVGAGNYGSATGPYLDDLWKYDPSSDSWTASNGIPGLPRYGCTSFVVNGKGYAHGGRDSSLDFTNELWEFDPVTENWTGRPPMPGLGRSWTMAMAFQHDAVVAGGKDVGETIFTDGYWYFPALNLWTQIDDYPGDSGWSGASFGIGDRTFGGLGARIEPVYSYHNDFWELVKDESSPVAGLAVQGAAMMVQPNPAMDMVRFSWADLPLSEYMELTLFDPTGRIMFCDQVRNGASFTTYDLTNGTYGVRLTGGNGRIVSTRLVVAH